MRCADWRRACCRAEIAEIDENLIRSNLTPAQEAEAFARRKAIYIELHPETRAGVAGANARWNAADNLSAAFSTETANATGKDERTIRRAAARGAALSNDLGDIAGTSLDKGVELDALRQSTARFVLMRPTAAPLIHESMFIRGEITNAVVLSLLVAEIALAAFWLAHS